MSSDIKKIKTGPEPKYRPDMCEMIITIAEKGGHVAQMCKELDIKSKDTFYRWCKEYPEFGEAYKTAKLYSEATWEGVLGQIAAGVVKGNMKALEFMMANKFPNEYKISNGTNSKTEININNTNNTLNLSSDQLEDKIIQQLEKLKSYGIEYKMPQIIDARQQHSTDTE